jgi:hypothetical protein
MWNHIFLKYIIIKCYLCFGFNSKRVKSVSISCRSDFNMFEREELVLFVKLILFEAIIYSFWLLQLILAWNLLLNGLLHKYIQTYLTSHSPHFYPKSILYNHLINVTFIYFKTYMICQYISGCMCKIILHR